MDSKRIETLEVRMTHLENYLDQLNEIILENNRLLETMRMEQESFRQQMREVGDHLPGPDSAKPPHY